jgi:hypothetical protein
VGALSGPLSGFVNGAMQTLMKGGQLGLFVLAVCTASCALLQPCAHCNEPLPSKFQPDPATPATVMTMRPRDAWTDTGITVHKGEPLLFAATGEVFWQARNRTTGPDGEKGVPGWSVGPGGLLGRVGIDGKPFDVGARTSLLVPPRWARSPRHPYSLPPVTMPRDGTLYLGFKSFASGTNTGMFEVTIRPAVPAAP